MTIEERDDGTLVVGSMEEIKNLDPKLEEMMNTILEGKEGENIDFVLIRSVLDQRVNAMPLIQMMSSLDTDQRLSLIFTQLKRDLGPEKWRDLVRQLALKELEEITMSRVMSGMGQRGN